MIDFSIDSDNNLPIIITPPSYFIFCFNVAT